jgi:hypothetical protein
MALEKTLKDHKLLLSREPLSQIASGLLVVLLLLSILPVMGQLEQPGPHAALTNSDSILYPSFDSTLMFDLTETRYMSREQQTVNGLSAFKLEANPQSNSGLNMYVVRYLGGYSIYWGIRVWQRFSNGAEIELTNGTPVAHAIGLSSRRLTNATWDCPRIDFNESDSVVVGVYSNGGWGWNLCAKFTTEQLRADYLYSSVWKVCYDTKFTVEWIGLNLYGVGTLYYGYNSSRIENFQYSRAYLEDGFESGSFNWWNGTSRSSGETATVVNVLKHCGVYSAMFASNGTGGSEYAYCYKTISSSAALYVRGYFLVSKSGIVEEGDCFCLLAMFAGSNGVAYAGWRKTGGVVKWCLVIRNGTSSVFSYSASRPALNQWYCVELHWKKDSANGLGELYINGAKVCSIIGRNTASYGNVTEVRLGLPAIGYCSSTIVYGDCAKTASTYIGPEFLLEDSFESGDFGAWSGKRVSAGETAIVTNARSYRGLYSAMFASNGTGGSEYAYCYKTISSSAALYVRGYFLVSKSGIVEEGDCFCLLAMFAGSNGVAYAGWRKTGGVVKWCLVIKDGSNTMLAYSASSPVLDQWYCVEVHWKKDAVNGLGQLWVNNARVCSITGKNTTAYGDVNQVRFGLATMYYCSATTIYCDDCVISRTTTVNKMYISPATVEGAAIGGYGANFTVTVWLDVESQTSAWQVYIVYNKTQLAVVNCGYTGSGKSLWAGALPTYNTPFVKGSYDATRDYLTCGELLWNSAEKAGLGSLIFVEFQIIQSPPSYSSLSSTIALDLGGQSICLDQSSNRIVPPVAFGNCAYSYVWTQPANPTPASEPKPSALRTGTTILLQCYHNTALSYVADVCWKEWHVAPSPTIIVQSFPQKGGYQSDLSPARILRKDTLWGLHSKST